MITCKDASRLISESIDHALGLRQRIALRSHLLMCTGCSRVKRQFEFMRRALAVRPGTAEDDDKTAGG